MTNFTMCVTFLIALHFPQSVVGKMGPDAVLRVLEEREGLLGSLYCAYDITHSSLEIVGGEPVLDALPGTPPKGGQRRAVHRSSTAVLLLDGDRWAIRSQGEHWGPMTHKKEHFVRHFSQTPQQSMEFRADSGANLVPAGYVVSPPEAPSPHPLEAPRYRGLYTAYRPVAAITALHGLLDKITDVREGGNAHRDTDGVLISMPRRDGGHLEVALDSVHGAWLPSTLRIYWDDNLVEETRLRYRRSDGGVVVLTQWTTNQFRGTDRAAQHTIEGSIIECTSSGVFDESSFVLDFPTGSHVCEIRQGRTSHYAVEEGGAKRPISGDEFLIPTNSKIQ